jgi:hypothetical protein
MRKSGVRTGRIFDLRGPESIVKEVPIQGRNESGRDLRLPAFATGKSRKDEKLGVFGCEKAMRPTVALC